MAKPNDPIGSAPKPKRTLTVRRDKPAEIAAPTVPDPVSVSRASRYEMIATAAYYLAERRGFSPGDELTDWLTAESAVEAELAARDGARH
jgi:Protein of unknown function (DUF2934)